MRQNNTEGCFVRSVTSRVLVTPDRMFRGILLLTSVCLSFGTKIHSATGTLGQKISGPSKATKTSSATLSLVQFDADAITFCNRTATEIKRTVHWWDLYAERPEMAQYPDKKITVAVQPTVWGSKTTDETHARYTYTTTFINKFGSNVTYGFQRVFELDDIYSWTISNGINFSHPVSLHLGLPTDMNPDASVFKDIISSESQTVELRKTQQFPVEQTIPVPPKTEIRIDVTFYGETLGYPWSADINVDGWIAIWYNEKWESHNLWFYTIGGLVQYDKRLEEKGYGLKFVEKGTFQALITSRFEVTVTNL